MLDEFDDYEDDFDDEFDKQVAERAFKPIESFLLKNKLKDQIREACRSIKEREKHYYHPNIYNEYELNLKLDNKTLITGKIDNLVVLDNQFAVCIDYKTGGSSSNFSPAKLKDGISTQLPTYILLVSGSEKFSDCQISGIYINHVLSDSISSHKDDDELIYDYLKLQGKTINDLSIVSKIDDTIADGVSSFIATVKLDKNQALDQRYVISSNEFDEYRDTVKDLFYDAARKIRNNDFEISPLFSKEKDGACKYCDFKDICYVKAAQRRLPKEEEDEQS